MSMVLYMVKASLAIMVLYFLYRLLFKRFTFFVFNRFYLLGSLLLAMIVPFIRLPAVTGQGHLLSAPLMINWEQIATVASTGQNKAQGGMLSVQLIWWLLLIYFLVAAIRFFMIILKYIRLRKYYADGTLVMDKGIRWNIHPAVNSPFTMFRTVYLDRSLFGQTGSAVRRHEEVHARQLHSIDLFISEMLSAFLWLNPFVFLFKRQIRENHEFLADDFAQAGGEGLVSYMQAFSEDLTRYYSPSFASHFRSSTIKNRIIMLTTKRSRKYMKWVYLLVIPVFALLIMAFQQPMDRLLPEAGTVNVRSGHTGPVPTSGEPGIPSRFPLDERYRDAITFAYDKHAKHPITEEMMTHKGIDFRAPSGTPVYATAKGKVAKSEAHARYGNLIVIHHGDSFTTLYAHLDENLVKAGEMVSIGQQIGTVGNTGLSTGPHLHYEVRKDGENVDPSDYY